MLLVVSSYRKLTLNLVRHANILNQLIIVQNITVADNFYFILQYGQLPILFLESRPATLSLITHLEWLLWRAVGVELRSCILVILLKDLDHVASTFDLALGVCFRVPLRK